MAYSSVAQAERDAVSDGSPSVLAASPTFRDPTFPPMSASFENLEIQHGMSAAPMDAGPSDSRLGSMLRSLVSSHSTYEMVDSHDHEEQEVTPLNSHNTEIITGTSPPQQDRHAEDEQTPIRTASISRHLPLSHPKSIQGPRGKNVERLEESAERLSMTASLEEELQRMKLEQRGLERQPSVPGGALKSTISSQHSSGSTTNSIIGVNTAARSGGYSPAGYITSPRGSIRSGSWLQSNNHRSTSQGSHTAPRLCESGYHQAPLDSNFARSSKDNAVPPSSNMYQICVPTRQSILEQMTPVTDEDRSEERPETSASNDTFQQAKNLFTDFDGVHYATQGSGGEDNHARRISLSHPPLASDGTAHREPQPGQNMVYYPAPVPMMLNLPQRLSKLPTINERERRRLQGLSEIPAEMRKHASWLPDDQGNLSDPRQSIHIPAGLPPQLRASAFFDQQSVPQNVQVVNSSAVATLDSLLDASAHAPVSAFTDHPIAGQLGKEIYGQEDGRRKSAQLGTAKKGKRRSSFSNMLNIGQRSQSRLSRTGSAEALSTMGGTRLTPREGKAAEDADADSETGDAKHLVPSDDEVDEDEGPSDGGDGAEADEEDDEDDHRAYLGPPTTLLAELQMRKAEQKKRNRTAADAFPNGMHSTLLELDAVTQLQQKSRKLKHITLAWEDHKIADRQNFDDEDVPLGLLFAGQKLTNDVNRPVGLLEKRDIEDNEPLSRRRARLRGQVPESQATQSIRPNRDSTLNFLDTSHSARSGLAEQEEETLAQRIQRMKAEKTQTVGAEFAYEVTQQLGLQEENKPLQPKDAEAEETLGQRRKRLREQPTNDARQISYGSLQHGQASSLISPHNQAGVPTAHPAAGAGGVSDAKRASGATLRAQAYLSQPYTQAAAFGTNGFAPAGFSRFPPVQANAMYNPALVAQPAAYGVPAYLDPMMGPPLDPKQRDQIDRWRQGIVQ